MVLPGMPGTRWHTVNLSLRVHLYSSHQHYHDGWSAPYPVCQMQQMLFPGSEGCLFLMPCAPGWPSCSGPGRWRRDQWRTLSCEDASEAICTLQQLAHSAALTHRTTMFAETSVMRIQKTENACDTCIINLHCI